MFILRINQFCLDTQFMVSCQLLFCSLCSHLSPDEDSAKLHMKSAEHYINYQVDVFSSYHRSIFDLKNIEVHRDFRADPYQASDLDLLWPPMGH